MFIRPRGLPEWVVICGALQESRGAEAKVSAAKEQIGNPGQSFLGQAAEKCRKWGFFGQCMLQLSVTLETPSDKVPP